MAGKPWINFSLLNPEIIAAIGEKKSQLEAALTTRVNALLFQLQTKIVAKIGQVGLKRQTGHLVGSVRTWPATIQGDGIVGSVGIPEGPTHDYATIHELGHAGSYRITATARKALAWQLSTKAKGMAFAKFTTHPPIPARGFVSSVREENREDIIAQLQATVDEVLKRKP
jgi:hypothetical protein